MLWHCALYYLSEEAMRRLVSHVFDITDLFLVQCNIGTPRSDADTFRRASVEFNLELLKEAGFAQTRVVAPERFERPLIVASK